MIVSACVTTVLLEDAGVRVAGEFLVDFGGRFIDSLGKGMYVWILSIACGSTRVVHSQQNLVSQYGPFRP